MLAAMMGMHASFTISDETMELCNELEPEGVDIISMWLRESMIFISV